MSPPHLGSTLARGSSLQGRSGSYPACVPARGSPSPLSPVASFLHARQTAPASRVPASTRRPWPGRSRGTEFLTFPRAASPLPSQLGPQAPCSDSSSRLEAQGLVVLRMQPERLLCHPPSLSWGAGVEMAIAKWGDTGPGLSPGLPATLPGDVERPVCKQQAGRQSRESP